MHKANDSCLLKFRREFFKLALEYLQGSRIKNEVDKAKKIFVDQYAKYEVEEILNNPYMNRGEIPLAMDIFKPIVPEKEELPVIVLIHGGGLVMGDRTMSRNFGKVLAGKGYLVFSIEYRLVPRANSAEQLDDVCAGMDFVGRKLVDFDVDFGKIYLMAESAGAYLAIYVAAMKESIKLQKAIGYEPSRMRFAALGLVSGMFYTNKPDPIGFILSEQFYGDKITDKEFLKYTDPENKEIVGNLPPTILITSRGDFLNNYTLMYHKKLKKAGRKTKLIYYAEMELGHAFVMQQPLLDQSQDALDKMLDWFEQKSKEKNEELKSAEKAKDNDTSNATVKQASDTKTKATRRKKPNTAKTVKNKKEANDNDSKNV